MTRHKLIAVVGLILVAIGVTVLNEYLSVVLALTAFWTCGFVALWRAP